jgi:hypothetical protein
MEIGFQLQVPTVTALYKIRNEQKIVCVCVCVSVCVCVRVPQIRSGGSAR